MRHVSIWLGMGSVASAASVRVHQGASINNRAAIPLASINNTHLNKPVSLLKLHRMTLWEFEGVILGEPGVLCIPA